MVESLSAAETIEKAKLCFSLGLIDQQRLEHVTRLAETRPGYDAIIDLPLSFEIQHELDLRAKASRVARRGRWTRIARRWLYR